MMFHSSRSPVVGEAPASTVVLPAATQSPDESVEEILDEIASKVCIEVEEE